MSPNLINLISTKRKKGIARRTSGWFSGVTMKKHFSPLLAGFILTLVLGCNGNIVQAPDQPAQQVSSMGQSIQILELPAQPVTTMEKTYKAKGWFTVEDGGTLSISREFKTEDGLKNGTISSVFTVDPYALNQREQIEMGFNPENLIVEFGPHGLQFNTSAKLYYKITGVNLSKLPAGAEIKLFYVNETTQQYEQMRAGSITTDLASGTIECVDGEIPHFSEYAFGYIKK